MQINSANITPNPVDTGKSIYIGVTVADDRMWLASNDNYMLLTSENDYLLSE